MNSTSNSLYVTVNQNINEEAIYQKIPTFPVNFTESGLAAGSAWYVNITGVGSSGPIINNSYSISLQNGTYSYSISTANKDYAPNVYSGSVTVSGTPASIPAITFTLQVYTASFTESGLSTGIWYVNLSNGMTGSADACSPITFTLQNETYSYTVSTSNKLYHPSLYADNVTVSGTTSASATFIASSYPVEFTESGIPVGAVWYINITGVGSSGPVTHDSYNFSLQNGTYSYFISTANKDYAPSSHSGGFTLNGNSSTIFTTFNTVNYTVTFNESNLPSGTKWYVNITGQPGSGAITGSSYTVSLINGSYSYTVQSQGRIYHASPGSFSVNGLTTSNSVSVSFSKVKYTVTFSESGLPSGTPWYVNLSNGESFSSSTNNISFSATNGSYTYTIATSDKIYEASQGSLTVNGASIPESVSFSKVTYSVTFTEKGLPSGTAWYVNLSNGMKSGAISGTSYTFNLTNGTYSYNIATTGKTYSASAGATHVTGKNTSQPITFSKVTYAVTFTESGLPSGTAWYVNITGQPGSGAITGSSYTVSLINGSYSYTVQSQGRIYHASPGSFTVNGLTTTNSVSVSFSKVTYIVTFNESNLPSGTAWYVNLSNGQSLSSSTNTISFSVSNGSYTYTISTSNKIYEAPPSSGPITVNGSAVPVSIAFSKVKYTVTFNESNLPSGTKWYVNITGQPGSGAITGSSYTVSLINGSYSYTVQSQGRIYHASPGSFSVNGLITSNSVSVSFSKVKYTVTFTESNLPSGTAWYVNLSNGDKSGAITGTSYSFSLINGSYSYTIGTTDKIYHASGGSFSANGNAVQVPIAFSKVKYTVTFTETGLLSGTAWYMNLSNGQSLSSSTNTISFSASNGSYTYTIATSDKIYEPSSQSGSFPMNGSSVSSAVTFSLARYTVTFKESGLPSNATWYVNLSNGMKSGAISGTSYTFNLPNGTYSYTLGNLTGYSISSSSTSISVNGNNLSKTITFSAIKKSSSKSGISSTELFGIIGGVVAFAVIGFTLAFQKKKR
ncbi:MAG: hypothetical protein M1597_05365 [Candidatus Thermoplasmatota archaeon]|nr:hypothetical protein [Candidatus Thermoplasmatota archaeon]